MKKILSILVAAIVAIGAVGCSSDAVAKVDGASISTKDFENQLKFYKWQIEMQYGENVWNQMKAQTPNYEENTKTQLVDSLARIQVFLNYAKKNDIKADQSALKQIKSQYDSAFKDSKIKSSYDKLGLPKDFLDKFAENQAILSGVSKFLEKKATPTEKELKAYYEKNKEQVNASHILISTTDKSGNPMTEDKKAEAKKKADEVYNKAKSGEDFAKLAKEYSDDSSNAQKGGELGDFGKGVMVSEFEKTVFAMKEGEISKPVETQFGYHIIKLNKKSSLDYNKSKEEFKTKIIQENTQKLVEEISKAAKIEKNEEKIKAVKFGDEKAESKDSTKNTEEKSTENKEEKKTDSNEKTEDKSKETTEKQETNSENKDSNTQKEESTESKSEENK